MPPYVLFIWPPVPFRRDETVSGYRVFNVPRRPRTRRRLVRVLDGKEKKGSIIAYVPGLAHGGPAWDPPVHRGTRAPAQLPGQFPHIAFSSHAADSERNAYLREYVYDKSAFPSLSRTSLIIQGPAVQGRAWADLFREAIPSVGYHPVAIPAWEDIFPDSEGTEAWNPIPPEYRPRHSGECD